VVGLVSDHPIHHWVHRIRQGFYQVFDLLLGFSLGGDQILLEILPLGLFIVLHDVLGMLIVGSAFHMVS
jgi:hypothetical protein